MSSTPAPFLREEHYNASLILTDVKLEVFRMKRYYNDITHLKYDCETGWPYEWVSNSILTLGFVLGFAMYLNFAVLYYRDMKISYKVVE